MPRRCCAPRRFRPDRDLGPRLVLDFGRAGAILSTTRAAETIRLVDPARKLAPPPQLAATLAPATPPAPPRPAPVQVGPIPAPDPVRQTVAPPDAASVARPIALKPSEPAAPAATPEGAAMATVDAPTRPAPPGPPPAPPAALAAGQEPPAIPVPRPVQYASLAGAGLPPDPAPPAEPGPAPDPALHERGILASLGDALPARLDGSALLSADGYYQTNALQRAAGTPFGKGLSRADFSTTDTVDLKGTAMFSLQMLYAEAVGGVTRRRIDSNFDDQFYDGKGGLAWQLDGLCTGDLHGEIGRRQNQYEIVVNTQPNEVTTRTEEAKASCGFSDEYRILADEQFNILSNSLPAVAEAGLHDRKTLVEADYLTARGSTLGIQAFDDVRNYPETAALLGGQPLASEELDARGVLQWAPGPSSSLSFNAGIAHLRVTPAAVGRSDTAPVFQSKVQWSMTPLTSLEFDIRQEIESSGQQVSSYVKEREAKLRLDHSFSPELTSQLWLSYQSRLYADSALFYDFPTDRQDHIFTAGLLATEELNDWLSLRLGNSLTNRRSDVPLYSEVDDVTSVGIVIWK